MERSKETKRKQESKREEHTERKMCVTRTSCIKTNGKKKNDEMEEGTVMSIIEGGNYEHWGQEEGRTRQKANSRWEGSLHIKVGRRPMFVPAFSPLPSTSFSAAFLMSVIAKNTQLTPSAGKRGAPRCADDLWCLRSVEVDTTHLHELITSVRGHLFTRNAVRRASWRRPAVWWLWCEGHNMVFSLC